MNDNQKKIATNISNCFSVLQSYDEKLASYKETVEQINAAPLIDAEKSRRREAAASELKAAAQGFRERVVTHLEAIRSAALAMEAEAPFSPELSFAVTVATAAGSKLDESTSAALVKPLIGHKQALTALSSVYAAQGISTTELGKYIFDAGDRCDDLEAEAEGLASGSIGGAYKMGKALEAFAALEGVELSEHFTSEHQSEYLTEQMRRFMGI